MNKYVFFVVILAIVSASYQAIDFMCDRAAANAFGFGLIAYLLMERE